MTTLEPKPVALPPDAIRAIEDLRARFDAVDPARQAHLDAIAELARIPREIVAELRDQGFSHAAIAEGLGITRQRAQQLSMSEEEAKAADRRAKERAKERTAELKRLQEDALLSAVQQDEARRKAIARRDAAKMRKAAAESATEQEAAEE
jgi:DNA-binding transcriptional MerR regulator